MYQQQHRLIPPYKHGSLLHLNKASKLNSPNASLLWSRPDWDLPGQEVCNNSIGFSNCEPQAELYCSTVRRATLWATANGDCLTLALSLMQDYTDLSFTNYYGQTPLSLAAEHGHEAIVKLLLLNDNVDINTPDLDGQTPLAWATFKGHNHIVDQLLERDDLQANSRDVDGNTPLGWAAAQGHHLIATRLLERFDVEISPVNRYGQTPLQLAVNNSNLDIAKLLSAWTDEILP